MLGEPLYFGLALPAARHLERYWTAGKLVLSPDRYLVIFQNTIGGFFLKDIYFWAILFLSVLAAHVI